MARVSGPSRWPQIRTDIWDGFRGAGQPEHMSYVWGVHVGWLFLVQVVSGLSAQMFRGGVGDPVGDLLHVSLYLERYNGIDLIHLSSYVKLMRLPLICTPTIGTIILLPKSCDATRVKDFWTVSLMHSIAKECL